MVSMVLDSICVL